MPSEQTNPIGSDKMLAIKSTGSYLNQGKPTQIMFCDICEMETVWFRVCVQVEPEMITEWQCNYESEHKVLA